MNQAFNRDCLEAMREMPDKYYDLAVVDPPYGGGSSQTVNVEREREGCTEGPQTLNIESGRASEDGLTATISATRTGGSWSKKYQWERRGLWSELEEHGRRSTAQTSDIGILLHRLNTSKNLQESARIKSYGEAITSICRRHAAS